MMSIKHPLCLIAFLGLLAGLSVNTSYANASANDRPNIVIIYADDMGYGDTSHQNPEAKLKTPNLDQLAADGMRFTDGHSSSGVCSPSRFALLCGTYHWRRQYRIIDNFGTPDFFRPGDLTIPAMLKTKGYNTGMVGKWHLGWNWSESLKPGAKKRPSKDRGRSYYPASQIDWTKPLTGGPVDHGFDYYFGDGTINFAPYCWIENDRVLVAPTVDLTDGRIKLHGTSPKEGKWEFRPGPMVEGWDPYKVLPTLAKKANAFIERQDESTPFFLFFSLPCPHAPIIPNDEFDGKSQAGPYGDLIVQTDFIVGQIIQTLKDKGFADNTIVIFTADNGPEKYAYDRIDNYNHVSSGPLRGVKRDTYEGGHRVPYLVKWPARIKAGSVCTEVVSQVDLLATFSGIVGHQLTNDVAVDSYNILDLMLGKPHQTPFREATIQNTHPGSFAVRQGDWVLINSKSGKHSGAPSSYYAKSGYNPPAKAKTTKTPNGLVQLFNLKTDLGQRNNVGDKHPERIATMQALLKKYREDKRSVPTRP